ncbi:tyrosine-type recombinase/integrase [Paenibacillus sp. HJGM_3]|uniref:tyrosine-type recombinase/integrase n=1 Tax=Paenibacillus sp. HJGM_3 TaxID=3379816 RepID=UPI003858FA46
MLLSEAWSSYESEKRIEGYSPHTLKAYRIQSNLFIRHIGDVEMTSVTLEQLKAYLAKDAARLKPASLGHRIRFLKSLFRWAMDEGHVYPNPTAKLKEPKQGGRIPKALNEEDIELLREACETPLEHALVEVLYTTGCRIGEIAGLNRNAMDWEKRSMVVRGKGDKEREVYFTTKCSIWMRKYLKQRNDTDLALFVTERNPHRRMSIAQIRYVIKRVARRAGITVNVYPHKLRHSYATHLLNNGAPLEAVQEFLGHTKSETTRIYAQLSGERRRELYRKYF